MKKAITKLMAVTLAACAITAEAATGSSGWFFVDTTSNELKISDVTSKYFDGEYGGKTGRKSTFLSGTPCEIEMTIVMDDEAWLRNASGKITSSAAEPTDIMAAVYANGSWGGDGISKAGGAADAPTAMMYDPVCGAWGAPVKLFDDERRESRLSGAVGIDGGLRIGYESASVATNAAGEVSLGATEVRTRFVPEQYDLAVVEDGFSFSTGEFDAGEEVSLTVKAVNLGFWPATDATVKVYEETDDARTELASVVTNSPGREGGCLRLPSSIPCDQRTKRKPFLRLLPQTTSEKKTNGRDAFFPR